MGLFVAVFCEFSGEVFSTDVTWIWTVGRWTSMMSAGVPCVAGRAFLNVKFEWWRHCVVNGVCRIVTRV